MTEDEKKSICSICESEIKNDDDFCPNCGSLFIENVKCSVHEEINAEGVCVICCEPYCNKCGFFVHDKIFLCNEHSEYENFEGMVRVYGSSDSALVEFAKTNIETEGLHPFIFTRKSSPMHIGGTDYSLFNASGEYDGHIINEIKLMVPLQELIHAEEILRDLKIIDE
jgi:hypothetical protein